MSSAIKLLITTLQNLTHSSGAALISGGSARARRCGYERRLLELLETLVRDMDRKIERQKERAVKESLPRNLTAADKAKLEDLLARQRGAKLPPLALMPPPLIPPQQRAGAV